MSSLMTSVVLLLSPLLYLSAATSSSPQDLWRLYRLPMSKYPHAVCLDGSPGAFWFLKGSGAGLSNFVIFHEGGGWCEILNECYGRSLSRLGSSAGWAESANCTDLKSWTQPCNAGGSQGLISHDRTINPVMHDWNKVYIGYCDGGRYT